MLLGASKSKVYVRAGMLNLLVPDIVTMINGHFSGATFRASAVSFFLFFLRGGPLYFSILARGGPMECLNMSIAPWGGYGHVKICVGGSSRNCVNRWGDAYGNVAFCLCSRRKKSKDSIAMS